MFLQADAGAAATFAGIRYGSRLGDDLTNWAIFEPNDPTDLDTEAITPDDADLLVVLEAYELRLGVE